MTIPVIPGPFSFLDTIGKGVAAYAGGREDRRKRLRDEAGQDRAEALKQVGVVFDAVQNNQLTTSALKSPFFLDLIKRSGLADQFAPENVAPKPSEQIAAGQSAYFTNVMAPGGDPTERQLALSTGKVPTASEALTERGAQLVGGLRNTRLAAGLNEPQVSAVTGIPGAATAAATDQTAQNPELGSIAKRVVRDLYVKNQNRIPTPAEAVSAVKGDLRAKPFANELTDAYMGNAIRDLQAELAAEETARIAASTRSQTNAANVVKDIKGQQEELRQRITARSNENNDLQGKLSPFAQIPGADPTKLTDSDKAALAKIQANNQANATDQETLTGLNQQAQQVIAPRVEASRGAPEAGLAAKRNAWDRAAAHIKKNPKKYGGKTPEQVLGEARP